jgi:hypothetical protein
MAWQDRRYRFAHQVGELLTSPDGSGAPVTGPALYGVCVTGVGLLYIGQTSEAQRRLRDLPVGESHHLATTVPPETWERVVVVQWPALLAGIPAAEARSAERLGPKICGLAMEHRLQVAYRPIMTARRRGTAGDWRERKLDSSRSLGALHGAEIPELFSAVQALWTYLVEIPAPDDGLPAVYADGGRVVFPATLITAE